MKSVIIITISTLILMIGCPWLAVTFAGTTGMAVCFVLFYAINPLFSVACGVYLIIGICSMLVTACLNKKK